MKTRTHPRNHWDIFRDRQRAEVAGAVIALVSQKGAPVTIAEIAERAGMSRRTFYKHFPSLGAAMLHTQTVVIDRIRAHADRSVPDGLNGRERLLASFQALVDLNCRQPQLMQFFSYFDFGFRHHGLTAEQHNELEELAAGQLHLPLDNIRAGQQDGSIRPDLDPETTAIAISNALVGVVQRLQVMDEYTDGRDPAAQRLAAFELQAWRIYLTPRWRAEAAPGSR